MSDVTRVTVEEFDDPLGTASQRQRLSEQETVERMYEAALRAVNETGLRVSFDLLSLEDVIADAGVSRSAVYKKWPKKDQFYSQVLLRLAGRIHPATAAYDAGTVTTVAELGLKNLDWFSTARGRKRLLVEMCRVGALHNFDVLRSTHQWQIYMALHATLLSLPDNRFQDAMRSALARSEESFVVRMSGFYNQMLPLLGFRFKATVGDVDAGAFAALGAAVVEGLVMTSNATTELAERRFLIDPFDTGSLSDWSYPALGFTSICLSLVEEDPDITWNAERVSSIEASLQLIRASADML